MGSDHDLYTTRIYQQSEARSCSCCCQGSVGPAGPMGPQGPTGAQGPQGIAGPQGPAGTAATSENAVRYNTATVTTGAGANVELPTAQINSPDGSITESGTDGLTLAPGQYLLSFTSDVGSTAAGDAGAALALDGTPIPSASATVRQTPSDVERITINTIANVTAPSTLTVQNNTATPNTFTNSTLTAVKLA